MLRKWTMAAALMVLLGSAQSGKAATWTWDGSGGTDLWGDVFNWTSNTAPVSDGSADLVFAGTIRPTPVVNTSWNIRSLAFDSSATAFNITGSPTLQIGGWNRQYLPHPADAERADGADQRANLECRQRPDEHQQQHQQ